LNCGKALKTNPKFCSQECSAEYRIKKVKVLDKREFEYALGVLLANGTFRKNKTINIEIDPGEKPFLELLIKQLSLAFNVQAVKSKYQRSKNNERLYAVYNTKAILKFLEDNFKGFPTFNIDLKFIGYFLGGWWDINGYVFENENLNLIYTITSNKKEFFKILECLDEFKIFYRVISSFDTKNIEKNIGHITIEENSLNRFFEKVRLINPYRFFDNKIERSSRYRRRGEVKYAILSLLSKEKGLDVKCLSNKLNLAPKVISNYLRRLHESSLISLEKRDTSWFIKK